MYSAVVRDGLIDAEITGLVFRRRSTWSVPNEGLPAGNVHQKDYAVIVALVLGILITTAVVSALGRGRVSELLHRLFCSEK